jgi:uncharacterized protein (DUF1499 family)
VDETLAPPARRGVANFAVAAAALAAAALMALAAAPAGWRLDFWHYETSFALMRYAAYLALLAVAAAGIALLGWRRLSFAARVAAVLALTVATVVVAVPVHYARLAATTPPIHDITTDTLSPPQFWTVLPSRAEENANTVEYGGPTVAQLQRAYYPEIAPVTTALPPPEAYAVALAVARSMPGWIDVTAEPESWRIEASQESFWMRFTDDVSIRVSPDGTGSRIDVRSVSRQGRGDFGVNARRVSAYADALKGRLTARGR